MNQRTIVLPADTLHFAITFTDPTAARTETSSEQLAAMQAPAVAVNTTDDLAVEAEFKLFTDVDYDSIVEAIQSDSRFKQRSLPAIQKYLATFDAEAVANKINELYTGDELTRRMNRNGVMLYAVAN